MIVNSTTKKQDTKETLLEVGTQLILRDGFNHTGINEILMLAGVPKGSFYYYFTSKEDFGLQVLAHFDQQNSATLRRFMDDHMMSPLERLRAYFVFNRDRLTDQGFTQGCLIGNMGQELSDQSEVFRVRLDDVMTRWESAIADCLRESQAIGELSADRDVHELAAFCLNSWQGAVLRMKVVKSTAPLESFIQLFFDHVIR